MKKIRGFSLIELMVVVAVVAIITSIGDHDDAPFDLLLDLLVTSFLPLLDLLRTSFPPPVQIFFPPLATSFPPPFYPPSLSNLFGIPPRPGDPQRPWDVPAPKTRSSVALKGINQKWSRWPQKF